MRLPARLTAALAVLIFAVCVYRAATQSVIIDEAFTYTYFVGPSLATVMTTYNTNHHIPNSLLAKITTSLFGVSELTLRIPTLLCCLIYLFAVRAIALDAFTGVWSVATFLLLTLNPLVLDLEVAARGYGPALAFLMLALWSLMHRKWSAGGIALGLCTASNLAFLCPVGCLGAMTALMDTTRKTFGRFIELVCIPAAVIPFVLYIVPLTRANPEQFAFGSPTLAAALRSYLELSIMDTLQPHHVPVILTFQIITLLILIASAVAVAYLLRNRDWSLVDRLILLNSGAMVIGIFMTWLAHVAAGAGYPATRTGVFWAVMITLGGMSLAYRFARYRWTRVAALAFAVLCIAQFGRQFRVSFFHEWQYDAGSKRIAQLILKDGGEGNFRIATSEVLHHSLRYYRDRFGAKWDVEEDPTGRSKADYYVLYITDERPGLRMIYRDPVSFVGVFK